MSKDNPINPNKLLLSKWTAVKPENKEKHFLVTSVIKNDEEIIVGCVLEAVLNHNAYQLDWRELKNAGCWLPGWN
ncbi:MAG: TIGR02450 family Trp-rich protein [Methylobacter sp.]